jgi:hypothetical protein
MDVKVLVIAANPFSDINNNGKTLKAMFSDFPKECLCEFYFRPQDNVIGDGEFAGSYYAVSDLDIIRSFLHFSKKCGGVQHFDRAKNIEIAEDKTYQRFLHGCLKDVRWLRSLLWKSRRWDTKEYREWYREQKPDLVFALLGGPGTSYTIAEEISQELNIPLAVYFTDDYLIHPIRKTSAQKRKYKYDLKAYKKIVEMSSARFCIGELMCKEYSEFFGKEFLPIMNLAEVVPYEPQSERNDKPVLSYFGDLWLDRWKMLSKLADLVGDKGLIKIYSGNELTQELKEAFDKPNIQFCGLVRGEVFKRARYSSDILLHVESDAEELRSVTALSISTKLPEYMMTGRAILGFGPDEVASMRLISDNVIGLVLSTDMTEAEQRAKLADFLGNVDKRNEFAKRGYDYAVNHFDKVKTAKWVKEYLIKIVDEQA